MRDRKPVKLGLIWAQFAAYHVDRCEAVAGRLGPRGTVLAIEVATTSADYAWEPSDEVVGAEKITLFPGSSFDDVHPLRRFWAMLRPAVRCDVVCIGLSYGLPDAILLSWTLRLLGRRVVVFSESKFDDKPRSASFEWLKALVLSCYHAAIVGGRRHVDYFRFLGFRRRPVLPGYDTVGVNRIRGQATMAIGLQKVPFAERNFLFVGRFVDKKNLFTLIRGYARYVAAAGRPHRNLVLAGSGPSETELRLLVSELALQGQVEFRGFLSADAVSRTLAESLGLLLVSIEEQWGLVVNEALALGLPVIVSNEVGARDLLVRNLENGYVVESGSAESIARAMALIAGNEANWHTMSQSSLERSMLGDCSRLADSLEAILFPEMTDAWQKVRELPVQMEHCP